MGAGEKAGLTRHARGGRVTYFNQCARCGSPKGAFILTFGKTRKIVCEDCRWTPRQSQQFRVDGYRRVIRKAVPDLSWLPEAARIREELAVKK
jgi:DNA-directed RNA polymerase subunit RPC12/RpoP